MQPLSDRDRQLETLKALLEGGVVKTVCAPDGNVDEALFKLVVENESGRHLFHVHATDLGWWVGPVRTRKVKPPKSASVSSSV